MGRLRLHAFVFVCTTLVLGFASAAPAQSTSTVAGGRVLVDGEPFFPIGIYHVSWIGDREHEGLESDLRRIAAAGLNVIHPTLQDQHGPLLELAAELGVYTIGELYPPRATEIIAKLAGYPAVLGWNVADDFNWPPGDVQEQTPAEVAARRDAFKRADPNHIAYGSGGGFPGLLHTEYIDSMDLMGIQSYPVGDVGDDAALEENWRYFEAMWERVTSKGGTYVANLQSFAWNGGRLPTPSEARNMLFASLLNGAKGVIWYTFYDGGGLLPELSPELWRELELEAGELAELAPFFLDGRLTRAAEATAGVHAGTFELGDELLVVAINTDRRAARPLELELPAGFELAAASIEPGGVLVERLQRAGAPPAGCPTCGDLDGDGARTLADVLVLLQDVVGVGADRGCLAPQD